ncbi:MAG: hypothetical protein HKN33_15860 [Pyrinomonadaceae bacterium]|nr:hypothetical protein [Pyrinomonadaceae bacterium]
MTRSEFKAVHPVLPVRNVKEAVRYYTRNRDRGSAGEKVGRREGEKDSAIAG